MPDVATNETSLYPANLFRADKEPEIAHGASFVNAYRLGLSSDMPRFDLHEIRLPSPQPALRLGAVYTSEEEMRYGPRHVDEEGLERIRTAVAERGALSVSPVLLK
jgi:hypothetical protein